MDYAELYLGALGLTLLLIWLLVRGRNDDQTSAEVVGRWIVRIYDSSTGLEKVKSFDIDEMELDEMRGCSREEFEDWAAGVSFFVLYSEMDNLKAMGLSAHQMRVHARVEAKGEGFSPVWFVPEFDADSLVALNPA